MWPILFHIGPFPIYSYGVSLAVAAVLCSWLLTKDAAKRGINAATVNDLVFWLVLSGIAGARLFYVYLAWDYYADNLGEVLLLNKGGLAWQGGFIGAVAAGFVFSRRHKIAIGVLFDLAAPYIALGQAIGRLGCFANGCCYGKPVAWGIYFPIHHAHLHPTQLYEAGSLLLIYVLLKWAGKQTFKPGMIFVGYLWLVAIERFVVEFYRADQMAVLGYLSLFQWISIVIFIVGLIIALSPLGQRRGK